MNWKKKLTVAAIAAAGSLMVFSWVVLMNRYITRPEKMENVSTVDFTVPTVEPPPPPPPRPPARRQESRNSAADLAPLPDLGASLSGIQLDSPDFMGQGQVSQSLLGDLDDVVMTQGAVDSPPIPRNVNVPYPARAKQRNLEGTVLISVHVDLQGKVSNYQILESSPPGIFDNAVLEAVSQWSFTPASYQGNPVETWVNIPIPFRLN